MSKEITTEQLHEKIDAGEEFTLIEVLMPKVYEEGHLPGAINIPYRRVAHDAGERLDKGDEVVVYCHDENCTASSIAAKKLESSGFQKVLHYRGGKAAWREAGHSLVPGPNPR